MEKDTTEKVAKKPGKRLWKWFVIPIGVILALLLLVWAAIAFILTPQRMTALVNRYGNEYFRGRAELSVGHAELTVWSTFPFAEIDIRDVSLTNPDPAIAAEGRTVASLERLHGRLNPLYLLGGTVHLGHVEIVRPSATFWQGPDSLTNLDIFPPSEPDKEESEGPLILPNIRLDRFAIEGDARFRYISVPDSLDADLTLRSVELTSPAVPQYILTTEASVGAVPLLPERLAIGLDGTVNWNPSTPLEVSVSDFRVNVDSLRTVTSAAIDFSNGLTVNTLQFRLLPLPLSRVASLLRERLPEVRTDISMELTATLRKPYRLEADTLLLPAVDAALRLGPGRIAIPEYHLDFSTIALEVNAAVSDMGLDSTRVDLKKFEAAFPGSQFSLTGSATNLASDPRLEGCFKGNINFDNIDRRVWQLAGMRLGGRMDADFDFRLSQSDLTVNTFHRANLAGQMDLREFEALLPTDTISAWTRHGRLEFGSSRNVERRDGQRADSMLTARITIDTASVATPALAAQLAGFSLGVGVENKAATMDSTTVTPMGGRIELKRLKCMLADSSRAAIRGLSGATVLTRYRGDSRRPLLAAKIGAERIVYADGVNRTSLSGALIAAKAHLNAPKRKRRELTAADSLRLQRRHDSLIMADRGHERIDFGVDRSLIQMLKRWDVRGVVKATGARLFTPAFPLRCRMTDLDFNFNPDSLTLRSMNLRAGRSDFALTGSVRNLQKSVGRKRGSQPLIIECSLTSDTINVNQLIQAAFRGAAWQQKADSLASVAGNSDIDLDDTALEQAADSESTDEIRAIVVPMNIDATLSFAARNIIYSTMAMHDFAGQVIIADGAAHLSDLHASTDIGSAALNLLYFAPTVNDVDVGLSMELNRFRIDRVTELMPALDSLMPLLRDLGGIIDVNVGATTRTDSLMNIDFPSLRAMVNLTGDSLKVLDEKTFKTMSKWLLFRDKKKNMIDHMEVELAVEDNTLELYPFMFDFDRYRIGVMGHNDLDMNLDYHVSILKSPIPFKFGINITGPADNMKIRPGRARFKEKMVGESVKLADTLRVNLAKELKGAIRRGSEAARVAPMEVRRPEQVETISAEADTISHADSLYFISQGLIEAPDTIVPAALPEPQPIEKKNKNKKKK